MVCPGYTVRGNVRSARFLSPHIPPVTMSIRTPFRVIAAASLAATVAAFGAASAQAPRFEVTVDPATRATPLTGRLVVVVSKTAQPEPRMIIAPQGPALFAVDLE